MTNVKLLFYILLLRIINYQYISCCLLVVHCKTYLNTQSDLVIMSTMQLIVLLDIAVICNNHEHKNLHVFYSKIIVSKPINREYV
jgi:hypothetical protein